MTLTVDEVREYHARAGDAMRVTWPAPLVEELCRYALIGKRTEEAPVADVCDIGAAKCYFAVPESFNGKRVRIVPVED